MGKQRFPFAGSLIENLFHAEGAERKRRLLSASFFSLSGRHYLSFYSIVTLHKNYFEKLLYPELRLQLTREFITWLLIKVFRVACKFFVKIPLLINKYPTAFNLTYLQQ